MVDKAPPDTCCRLHFIACTSLHLPRYGGGGCKLHAHVSATATVALATNRQHPHCGRRAFTQSHPTSERPTAGQNPHRAGSWSPANTTTYTYMIVLSSSNIRCNTLSEPQTSN
jgi:hypothetical protein